VSCQSGQTDPSLAGRTWSTRAAVAGHVRAKGELGKKREAPPKQTPDGARFGDGPG